MKPTDLKPPFPQRSERRVVIQDRVWFMPVMENEELSFTFPGWSSPLLFGNDRPVHVEYCSGNGDWIIEKAMQHPEINWLAVEVKFMRVRKIWSKMKNLGLDNLVILCGEGKGATQRYFPKGSVDAVYVHFPDPWPKRRHAKYRIIEAGFASELARILRSSATATLVTDDPAYSAQMIEVMRSNGAFASVHPAPYYITADAQYGPSYFEALWRQMGRTIFHHQFSRL